MIQPRILVVIVTYNGQCWLNNCLGSLHQSSIPLDVVVIDNQSTDATVATIKQGFPNVQLIETKQNLGFGRANNVGLKKALEEDYDYAFLLNQDAWTFEDTIQKLVYIHQKHPEYGILSPVHLNREKIKLDSKFAKFVSQAENLDLMSDLLLPDRTRQEVYALEFVNAAAWLISRECLRKVGGFDPLFFHYGEDEDYVQRLIYHKFKIGFVPHAQAVHDREGYVKQSDLRSSLPTQYKDCLIILKNVHRSFNTNLYVALRNEVYNALVAFFTLDLSQLVVKLKLLRKIIAQSSTARQSRKYCMTHPEAYLT